ncbi:MAG: glycosyltransferase [Candidatus Aenigmarchaeota archaeon]|nr:glycosyltransferase [Candidatus Aenigmarchaeota archaeon]
MISLIVPSFNEQDYIETAIRKITGFMKGYDYELIVVEESTDRTPEIVERLSARNKRIKHMHFDVRLGKGGAIEKGVEAARGEYVVFMDADLSTDLSSIKLIVENLPKYDVVVGSRYHPLSRSDRTVLRLLLSKAYSVCVRALLGLFRPNDLQCGMKGFKRSKAMKIIPLRNRGFFWDTEFIFYAKRLGFSIGEVPVVWVEKKVRGSGSGKLKNIIYMGKSLVKLFIRNLW